MAAVVVDMAAAAVVAHINIIIDSIVNFNALYYIIQGIFFIRENCIPQNKLKQQNIKKFVVIL